MDRDKTQSRSPSTIPLLPNRIPISSLKALSAKLPISSLSLLSTSIVDLVPTIPLQSHVHLIANLYAFTSPRYVILPLSSLKTCLQLMTASLSILPVHALNPPSASDARAPAMSWADATQHDRGALPNLVSCLVNLCTVWPTRNDKILSTLLLYGGGGLVHEIYRKYVRNSPLGKDENMSSLMDPSLASAWPHLLLLTELYAQSLSMMGDDELFYNSRTSMTLDELMAFSRALFNIMFALYWRDDQSKIQEGGVPGLNLCWSNVQTHIRTHTRERSKTCPHPGCAFATTNPASLTRHRKHLHSYEPKVRRNLGGKAARRSAAAPYPSTRFMRPEEDILASLDLNDLTFPRAELAGLIPCNALSPAESSNSDIPKFSGKPAELSWERLFPDFPAESFTSIYEQPSQLPIPTSNHSQPSTFDLELFSDVNYQHPIPAFDADLQCQPVSGNHLNNSLPAELEEFLQVYGSGYFEGRYEYPDDATYSMPQPSFTNEYNIY
ncbi:hypothetical protein F4604DRAFT_2044608 [Suillus subluteus]|nr:hypothetical protein F4604DRAFT_2044608 [Suillus subluteus]